VRDGNLVERMRQGSEGSFTIVNRPVRANRPFSLENSFAAISSALTICPQEVPGEEVIVVVPERAPAQDVLEVIPVVPEDDVAPEPEPVEVLPIAPEPEADPDPGPEAEAPEIEAETDAEAEQTGDAPEPGLTDPAARVLAEIEATCIERGGAFVEVREDFTRRADFDGDGIEDLEVSYFGAVCDAAAGLYCDTDSCLTHLYLGQADGTFVRAFSDIYMSARIAPALVVTYDADSPACRELGAPCEKTYIWRDGVLVALD
jgi:hypothetical protein